MQPRQLFDDRIFTLSNFLTSLRVLIVPVIIYFFYKEDQTGDEIYSYYVLGAFGIIIFSDFFDGLLARLLKQETKLGQLLDPAADKISAMTIGVFLCIYKGFPVWLYILSLVREVLFVGLGAVLYLNRDVVVKPNIFGKFCAASLAFSAVVYSLPGKYILWGVSLNELAIFLILTFYILSFIVSVKNYAGNLFGKK